MSSQTFQFNSDALKILDFVAHPLWVFSADSLAIIYANSAAQAWIGFDLPELQSLSIEDIRTADERDSIRQRVRDFSGASADAGTWTVITKSGERRRVSFFWQRITLNGRDSVLATIRDKTIALEAELERQKLAKEVETAERSLQLTEDAFRSLFEAAPGKMLVLTPRSHEIVAATDEYLAATMTERSKLYGRALFNAFPDDPSESEADGATELAASLQRVEKFQTRDVMDVQRYPIRDKEGRFVERFWLTQNKPIFNSAGEMVYIIHRVEDVTAIRNAESAPSVAAATSSSQQMDTMLQLKELRSAMTVLQEREARLRLAKNMLKLGTWDFKIRGEKHLWSERALEIFGSSLSASTIDHDHFLALIHPEDLSEVRRTFEAFITGQEVAVDFQYRMVRTDGSIGYIRAVGERQKITGQDTVIGFVQDISDFVASKIQLLEAQELIRRAGESLQIGGWRVDPDLSNLIWTEGMFQILEVPQSSQPSLDAVLELYSRGNRERVFQLVQACAREGCSFDEVVEITTARGNSIIIRVLAWPVYDDSGVIVAVQGAAQDISGIKIAERTAADANAKRLDILERISDAFFSLDTSWRFQFLNSQAENLLGRSRESLINRSVWDEFPEAVGSAFETMYQRAIAEKSTMRFQEYYPALSKWFDVTAYPMDDGLAVYFRDASEDRRRTEHLRLLEAAADRMNDLLIITEADPKNDPHGPKIVYVNRAVEALTGWAQGELLGRTPRVFQGPGSAGPELDKLRAAILGVENVQVELINYDRSGKPYWIDINMSPIIDDQGQCTHFIAVERDISDWKKTEAEQLYSATRDALTGCLNRASFSSALDRELQALQIRDGTIAVILIDCDNFKTINDTLGHAAGDALLKSLSERLLSEIGQQGTLGRLGGDEFIIFVPDLSSDEAVAFSGRIRRELLKPFYIENERLSLTASIGVAIAPLDGNDADNLIRNADIAMYHSKSTGRNKLARFNNELRDEMFHRTGLTQALQKDLPTREGFWLAFQPQFCLNSRCLVGAEALLRWKSAERGDVSPADFIPAAENSGLMRMLDRMVVDLAAQHISEWIATGNELHVSVNLSAQSLQVSGFAHHILTTLSTYGVPPRLFGVEITESMYLENSPETRRNIVTLRDSGVQIAIDDFGTGHSSLSYLQRLPLDVLKIDRSFVQGVKRGARKSNALIKAMLAMAKALGLRVVAEGVETDEQLMWLSRNGCDTGQGFLLGKPEDPRIFFEKFMARASE